MRYIRKELQFLCRDLLDTLVRYREFLFLVVYQTISLIQQMILLAHFTININRVNSGTTQQKRQYQDNNQGTIKKVIFREQLRQIRTLFLDLALIFYQPV